MKLPAVRAARGGTGCERAECARTARKVKLRESTRGERARRRNRRYSERHGGAIRDVQLERNEIPRGAVGCRNARTRSLASR